MKGSEWRRTVEEDRIICRENGGEKGNEDGSENESGDDCDGRKILERLFNSGNKKEIGK